MGKLNKYSLPNSYKLELLTAEYISVIKFNYVNFIVNKILFISLLIPAP